jgi:carboxymethylenebutenolidase
MCDEHSMNDMADHLNRTDLTRRKLGALSVAAGIAATLPRVANALDVTEKDVTIKTPDGTAEAFFVHPTTGKHPAVLIWPDAFGLRPAFRQMAKRLAESGYAVVVPNPYYRVAKVPVLGPDVDFRKPEVRESLGKVMPTLTPETNATDAKAFIDWLDAQTAVDTKRKIGTTGYCMGGAMTMRTAAQRPDRVGAIGSFHGGGLVTDQPTSPHLLIPKMKIQALIAIAENDDQAQPTAKTVLGESFKTAGLKAEIEVYTGAQHGWCPPDMPVYNAALADRAWDRLLATFKSALV